MWVSAWWWRLESWRWSVSSISRRVSSGLISSLLARTFTAWWRRSTCRISVYATELKGARQCRRRENEVATSSKIDLISYCYTNHSNAQGPQRWGLSGNVLEGMCEQEDYTQLHIRERDEANGEHVPLSCRVRVTWKSWGSLFQDGSKGKRGRRAFGKTVRASVPSVLHFLVP